MVKTLLIVSGGRASKGQGHPLICSGRLKKRERLEGNNNSSCVSLHPVSASHTVHPLAALGWQTKQNVVQELVGLVGGLVSIRSD